MSIEEPLKKGEPHEESIRYEPTEAQTQVINRVHRRFKRMQQERDKSRRIFDGRNLRTYVRDCVDQYNGIVSEELRASKEDWQSLAYDHITRGKVKAVTAMAVGSMPFINLIGEKKVDDKYAQQMKLIHEFEWREQDENFNLYVQALDACTKGTSIVEEYYEEKKVKRKEVSNYNQETGKITYKEKTRVKGGYGRVRSRIVPILNFYPNENFSDIKGDCIVFDFPTIDEFQKRYSGYHAVEAVVSGFNVSDLQDVEYERLAQDKEGIVEVLKYYNEDDDEFILLANGIWINPQGDSNEEVAPLPYNHKSLPFSKMIYEMADSSEFYGKALPDIMTGEQETINAILRLVVDKEVLALNRPMLLGMGAELETYQLVPGGISTMSGDIAQAREMDISEPSQASFSLMNFLIQRSNVNTAIDPMSQGVSTGGRKTARESMILDQNTKQMISTFQKFIFHTLVKRAKLRIQNIKQFYTKPIQWVPVLGEDGEYELDEKGNVIKQPEYRTVVDEQPGKKPSWVQIKPAVAKANFLIRLEEDMFESRGLMERMERAQALMEEAKVNPLINADQATLNYLIAYGFDPGRFYIGRNKKPDMGRMAQELGQTKNDLPSLTNNPAESVGGAAD